MMANASRTGSFCQVHYAVLVGDVLSCNDEKAIGLVNAVICHASVVANSLTLFALYKHRTYRLKSIISQINLLICSLLVGSIAQPLLSLIYLGKSIIGAVQYCRLLLSFEIAVETLMACSFLTICFVGLERYISIFYPFRETVLFTPRRTILVLLAIWCISLLSSMLVLVSSSARQRLYYLDLVVTILGALWMGFVYCRILLRVRKVRRRVTNSRRGSSPNPRPAGPSYFGKRTWITVVVISLMIMFHTLYDIVVLLSLFSQEQIVKETKACQDTFSWVLLLYLSLSLVVPVTLWIGNSHIRRVMKSRYACILCYEEEPIVVYRAKDCRVDLGITPVLHNRWQGEGRRITHNREVPEVIIHAN